ncbi:uncharacterized protein SPAPADRAFT_147455 [Spathaspora passalidarum NRRL Y-27907]|uniref:Sister chromatid cohesion protein n=1 Tax=Spathaspora passalidarum (strain NRRL Y-27907 / 11-Y1) TaxID=619300 RepID=G3AEW7_SPAPN|nr:uncharacterized protein SPAPADRAFT_147455 [Spathaspora passalidarum NRRL Y-27907]EGW35797.1 hypothetical protein SPAPADRAFT_147455 [Spathaspora passalidarum NRRL Y-27907]
MIIEEVMNFDDEELQSIRFERFTTIQQPSENVGPTVELKGLEAFMFNAQPINESFYQDPSVSAPPEWSKLSVRKKYDSTNKKVMDDHNQKYVTKFNNLRKQGTSKKAKRKRDPEQDGSEERNRKVIKFSELELHQIAETTVKTFVLEFPINESQEGKVNVPIEKLEEVSDSLTKILESTKDVDTQEVANLQRICHKLLSENIEKIKNDININSFDDIANSLVIFSQSAIATEVLLEILNSSIEDKSLFWDGYLDSAIEFVTLVFQDLLLPISQFSMQESAQMEPLKYNIGRLFREVSNLLRHIGNYNSKSQLEDQALTRIEILLTQVLFEEKYQHDKKSMLSLLPMDSIKISAGLVFVDIFRSCKDQRPYLLNELILNFPKLSTNKANFRQFKIERGFSVQYFTVILVKFIQSIESEDIKVKDSGFEDTISICDQIAVHLTTITADKFSPTLRTIFDFIVEDLLVLLPYPEWSAVEFMLTSLAKQFLSVLKNSETVLQIEVYFLEILGLICERVVSLEKLGKSESNDDIKEMLKDFNCIRFDRQNSLQSLRSRWLKSTVNEEIQASFQQALEFKFQSSDMNDINKVHPVYTSFILGSGLNLICMNFLDSLGQFLNSPKVKIRTKAVKILVNISEVKPNLFRSKKIQEALSARLLDASPLVRDAVFDFIGKYVQAHPNEADNFCAPLCNALGDTGISVRKRATKFAKDLYPKLTRRYNKVEVACKLLKRMDDEEDSVRNISISALIELLFLPLVSHSCTPEERVMTISVLVDICNSGTKVLSNLEVLLERHVLNSPEKGVQDAKKKLIELILEFVNDESMNEKVLFKSGALLLLASCVKSQPNIFGQDQLIALQPLITDEAQTIDPSYGYTLRVLRYSLVHINSLQPSFLVPVQNFLFKRLSKLTFQELDEAIPSLWKLCDMNSTKPRMINSVIATLKFLYPYIENKQRRHEKGLGKLLQLLGFFGKYCNFQEFYDSFKNSGIGLKNNESVVSLILKYIMQFCDDSTEIKNRIIAISTLITVCTSYTKLFGSEEVIKIFDREMDSNDTKIVMAILRGLIDFLNEKDADAQKKAGYEEKSSADNKLDVRVFHGISSVNAVDGVCAGMVQRYLNKVLKLCLSSESQVSYLPIQFVKRALELGYANPKMCIATIMALESSNNEYIRKTGIEMHQDIYEKHESIIESSYREGVSLALSSKQESEILVQGDFFNLLYRIVSGSVSSSKKFMKALGKGMSIISTKEKDPRKKLVYSVFYANNIANLEFKSMEELFIITSHLRSYLVGFTADTSEEENVENSSSRNQEWLSIMAMMKLYNHLTYKYHILDSHIDDYDSHASEIDLKQTPKVLRDVKIDLSWIVENVEGENPEIITKCKEELKQLI